MITTPSRIRTMGKEFTSLSDDQLNMCIEDASLEVSSLLVPEEHKERLTRYLAAHLATANVKQVIKEKVDVIERTYSDSKSSSDGLSSTSYGQEYQRILLSLATPKKKTLNLMVL